MNIDTTISTTYGKIKGHIEKGLGVWQGIPNANI